MQTTLYSKADAGKTVKTRWGNIPFDKDGVAKNIDIPAGDFPLLQQLKWTTDPDAVREAAVRALHEQEEAAKAPKNSLASAPERLVQSSKHRNTTVKCRWGHVSFDKDGIATVRVPDADIALIGQLGWSDVTPKEEPKSEAKGEAKDDKKKDKDNKVKVGTAGKAKDEESKAEEPKGEAKSEPKDEQSKAQA